MGLKQLPIAILIILTGCYNSEKSSQTDLLTRQLVFTAKKVYDRGLQFGTGGDISVKIAGTDSLIIKPTGYSLGYLQPDKLVVMDLDGNARPGSLPPSHETEIHCEIYRLRPEVGAIMHMHAPYAAAWSTAGKMIPIVTQQSVNLLKNAAMVPYYKVGTKALNDAVTQAYKNPDTYVVYMQNHGTFVVGKDLDDLYYKADVVENTARIAYLSTQIGTPIIPEYVLD